MSRFFALSVCLILALASSVALATGTNSLPLGTRDFNHSQANLAVSRTSPEFTTISLASPVVIRQDSVVDYQTYQLFGIGGEYSLARRGEPTVPQVTRYYHIPNTGGADLVITNAEYDVVDNINAFPVQPDRPAFGLLTRDDAVYSKDGWYPENVATMSDPMIMRDFRVVTVTLYPVQVNPVTHQARIYRNLSAQVVANDHASINELTNPHRPSREWAAIYQGMIANLEDYTLDNVTTTPGSIIILTSTNSIPYPFADSLAEWKTRMGYKVTLDARASWTSTQAISDIRTAYANAPVDAPLEYAVLMGDPGASWAIPVDNSNSSFDHTYALGNTGDDIEDIGVGRLSGSDAATLATINAKIMGYERAPHVESSPGVADTMWFHKAFLYAGTARGCADNALCMLWGKQQFINMTTVDSVDVATHTADNIVETDVTTRLNAGVGFFIWRGSWIGGMQTTCPANCNSGWRLPICMTVTCDAGDYASSAGVDSPAEGFLCDGTAASPRGAVCGIGTSTSGTENGANIILASGLIYGITDLQVEHLGTCVAGAKAQLFSSYPAGWPDPEGYSGGLAAKFTRLFNLLGDPSLSMWTDVPRALTITAPTSLSVGATSVDVTVRRTSDNAFVQDAVVCLWKHSPDSTWVKGLTDSQGHITLPVNVRQSGSMYLTITKHNVKPYLSTINCAQAAVMPMLSSYTLDDDNVGGTQGNGDHLMNPGETIDLPVYVRNFGSTTTATGISASLTSNNSRVTVTTGSATYTNLAPGDSVLGSIPFRIHAASDLQNATPIQLTMTITSSAGQTVGVIPLTCFAGAATYQRQYLNPAFVPGGTTTLTVVVKNTGSITMPGVTAHLVSLSPFVPVGDADAVFGDIAAGALDSNNTDALTLSAANVTFRGHQAPMQLIMTTTNGFVDTTQFNVFVGTAQSNDPTGPDAFGYYAFDNTDVTYTPHPTFSYVDISTTGENLNLNDSGDKTTVNPIWSAARHLPFSFKFYGHVYDSVTVCSNGWCAFGNQSWYDGFRNFQIPAMRAPDAMIAPYWDDLITTGTGHGVWVQNDAANHRYIIQWKATAYVGSPNLDFEVMLYDTTYQPTVTGNGNVLVQYNHVVMNIQPEYGDDAPGSTIGIQMPGNTVGLQYAYQNTYSPGAATVQDGRTILFSTENSVSQLVPMITITSPIGGEQWYSGLVYNINWSTVSVPGLVNISLNRSYPNGTWESLFTNATNRGSQPWTVTLPTASNSARIRIMSISLPTVGDTSTASFSILMPSLTITSPIGGETWATGQDNAISWNYNPLALGPARVELNRSYPNGAWEQLSASSSGTLVWTVTGAPTNTARVRVIAISVPTLGDTSHANFTIGVPPVITHTPHADANLGPVLFVAKVTDDVPGFTTKLFYRVVGGPAYDSLTLAATGYLNEFAATTPALNAAHYEYYFRSTDAQLLSTYLPISGTNKFDVGALGSGWIAYDDSSAENYNWVDGANWIWAVKFDPGTYPFALTAGRFAICPTNPPNIHGPIIFQVMLADGSGGLPGTVVFTDTTGCAGNVAGGLPAGAAWADVVTRSGGQALQMNMPFYLSVMNVEPRATPVAFGNDTSSTRDHMSFVYDNCNNAWYNEDAANPSTRPGNRMIRASGFPLGPLTVVIFKTDSADVSSSVLRWTSNGAPYYHIYCAANATGPFDTLLGSIPGPVLGQPVSYTDLNSINQPLTRRFYRVLSADVQ